MTEADRGDQGRGAAAEGSHEDRSAAGLDLGLPRLRHDLLTPVNQILGYSELLEEELSDMPAVADVLGGLRADLGRIRAAGHKLLEILDARLPSAGPRSTPTPSSTGRSTVPAVDLTSPSVPTLATLRGNLLVVDDDPANLELLARHLQREGHKVTVSASGAEALDLLSQASFDVLLLDMVMPEMDGLAVLQRVRANEALRSVAVIMISALSEQDSVVRCIELGAEDYLPKPTSPVLLRARIGACLEKKRLRDREQRLFLELSANYQRLQDLERLRDDLTSMIIHDLRTPLSALMTGLQALPMLGHLDPPQERLLKLSLRGGHTLLGMINDLLDISRMEDGSLLLNRHNLHGAELVDLIEQATAQVAPLAQDKGLTLQRALPPPAELPEIAVDEEMVRRVLVNLLGNAIKFTSAKGQVTLSASVEPGRVIFAVRDTGRGIPKEAFARIFDKFGVVEERRAGKVISTGLGLAFCRMVVEAHGGTIWVESELGRGSCFLFSVPLRSATTPPRPEA